MQFLKNNRYLAMVGLAGILIGICALLYLVSKPQDSRSRAAASSKLYFTPTSSANAPLKVKPGDTVSLDLIVDPGTNLVDTIRIVIDYDPSLFGIPSDGVYFEQNKSAFPEIIKEPVLIGHKIAFTIKSGSTFNLIRTPTKIGTIKLKTLASTNNTPAAISATDQSAVFSVGAESQYAENVLSSTLPALVTVEEIAPTLSPSVSPTSNTTPTIATPTPTNTLTPPTPTRTPTPVITIKPTNTPIANPTAVNSPTPTVSPSPIITSAPTLVTTTPIISLSVSPIPTEIESITPTITLTATPSPSENTTTPTPTPTDTPHQTTITMDILLHGIGSSGDNVLPLPTQCKRKNGKASDACLSNQNPVNTERDLVVSIYNQTNHLVKKSTVTMKYDPEMGGFKAVIPLGSDWSSGIYDIQVATPKYLSRYLRQNFTLNKGTNEAVPQFDLIASDVTEDDSVNILDWNLIATCYTFPGEPSPCAPEQIAQADVDDDNDVDDFDLNLFKRELMNRSSTR